MCLTTNESMTIAKANANDDHQRHLNEGVNQHPAHTGPEIAGRKHVLEILESYEFIHQFAAAVRAAASVT